MAEHVLIGVGAPGGTIRPVGHLVPGSVVCDPDTQTVTMTVFESDLPDWLTERPQG